MKNFNKFFQKLSEIVAFCTDGIYRRNLSIPSQTKSIIIDKSCSKLAINSLELSSLEEVRLPNTLIEIEDNVFINSKIKKLFIPKSTIILNFNNSFNFMPYLERIDVDPNNPCYTSKDGILFSKGFDQIIHYPMHITSPLYIVPRAVRFINPYCFLQHEYITTLIFHDKILELRQNCFRYCQSLKIIMIPNKFSLPKNLTNSFIYSNFHFPEDIVFYDDISESCTCHQNIFELPFLTIFITTSII